MAVELVKTQTPDGLRLDGALYRPASRPAPGSPDAVVLLHGVGGNFYSSALLDAFVEPLLAQGVAVLRVNTRGHDGLFSASTFQGWRLFGAAYEMVDECRYDFKGWRQFLGRAGFSRIALVGHSLGAVKAIFMAAHSANALTCIAALSPPRLSYRVFQESGDAAFQQAIALAETLVAEGTPDELIHARFPFPLIISARSYVDKYGREERYDLVRHLPNLPCPALIVYGDQELAEGKPPFAGIDRTVAAARRDDQPLEVIVVAGADHFYNGVHSAAADLVTRWLTSQRE
jgi:pimeloyl-ACP methyl ester carboxylesterase